MSDTDVRCLLEAVERERARADRSEAEFCACKALLIAAQKRGERAEAERAEWKDRAEEAERSRDAWRRTAEIRAVLLGGDDKPFREEIADAQKDVSEARAALEHIEPWLRKRACFIREQLERGDGFLAAGPENIWDAKPDSGWNVNAKGWREMLPEYRTELAAIDRALAALPVEPARRQVTDNANALGAPAAGCSEEER